MNKARCHRKLLFAGACCLPQACCLQHAGNSLLGQLAACYNAADNPWGLVACKDTRNRAVHATRRGSGSVESQSPAHARTAAPARVRCTRHTAACAPADTQPSRPHAQRAHAHLLRLGRTLQVEPKRRQLRASLAQAVLLVLVHLQDTPDALRTRVSAGFFCVIAADREGASSRQCRQTAAVSGCTPHKGVAAEYYTMQGEQWLYMQPRLCSHQPAVPRQLRGGLGMLHNMHCHAVAAASPADVLKASPESGGCT